MSDKESGAVLPEGEGAPRQKGLREMQDRSVKELTEQIAAFIRQASAATGIATSELMTKYVLPSALEMPEWAATNGGVQIGHGAVFNSGAFCIYWGEDPDTGKPVGLLHVRKEKKPDGTHQFGAVGGYTTVPEQPVDGLARETREELRDAKGNPVFEPNRAKYCLIDSGKDFSRKHGRLPIEYTAYAYELSPEEIRRLKAYEEQLADAGVREAVEGHTNRETYGIRLLPLEEIVCMRPDDFAYHRHYDTFREVASRLGLEMEGLVQHRKPGAVGYEYGINTEISLSRFVQNGDGEWVRYTREGVQRPVKPNGEISR